MPRPHPLQTIAATVFIVVLASGIPNFKSAQDESLAVTKLPLEFADEYDPACVSLTEDSRLLTFQSPHDDGYGQSDIWLSEFRGRRWLPPTNAGPGINTAASEYDGKLSADGSTMVFIRSDENMKPSIFITYFRDGEWTKAEHVGAPVSFFDVTEYGAVLSRDGHRLYFSSNMEGGYGGFDVYVSERNGDAWGEPVNLGPKVNSEDDEIDAALGSYEQSIILAFDQEDTALDLFITRKSGGEWEAFADMGPRVNTPAKDVCPWLGYDGQTLYLNTTWDGLIGGNELSDSRWGFVHVIRSSEGF